MLVPPPGLLSMTNCWPSRSDSHCPIKRATMSYATGLEVLARDIACGQPVAGRHGDNLTTTAEKERTAADMKRACARLRNRREGRVEVAFRSGLDDHDLRGDGTTRLVHAQQFIRCSRSVRIQL